MSFATLLIHTCTIERYTEGIADAYGNPTLTWANHLVDEPCRLMTGRGGGGGGMEIKVGAELVIADYKLFVESIDITEQDRVTISGNTYEILLVQDYADDTSSHHKECWLRISR